MQLFFNNWSSSQLAYSLQLWFNSIQWPLCNRADQWECYWKNS